jgi:hypothetical protein
MKILEATGANELHGTFRSQYDGSMVYRNPLLGTPNEEHTLYRADGSKIKSIISAGGRRYA